ncbi:hypothetical protein ACIQBJ_25300 [Kitasatospora sp. NPDC088391]|uniref:hypothetical protein n=1 Tax=Kitasatospora sp. NPDC088391 TaxID=3364074 RepID=UPI00380F88C7
MTSTTAGHLLIERLRLIVTVEQDGHAATGERVAEVERILAQARQAHRGTGQRVEAALAALAAIEGYLGGCPQPAASEGQRPAEGRRAGRRGTNPGPNTIGWLVMKALERDRVTSLDDVVASVQRARPGTGANRVRTALTNLVRAGVVENTGRARYRLLDKPGGNRAGS